MPEQGGVALTGAVAPFWLSFPNFVPDSTAPFEREFTRLARIEGWHATQKKGQLTGAVASELASMSGGVGALEQWKSLCRVVGITEELASITQCRKALRSIFVNLFNLIDHRRNPDVELVRFASRRALSRDIKAKHMLPREAAKQAGPIRDLLIRVR